MFSKIKKFCWLLCLFNQVSINDGSVKSPKLFEDLLLKEIIHSIDVASDNENLFEIILKLLNNVCSCMQETLNEKQNSIFNVESNILREDEENTVSNIELYKKIYNRTCINLKQKVMKKIYENYNVADINVNKLHKRQFYIDKITKENMERTLFEILVKNYKNRKYRIRNLDSYKNKILMTNKNEYNVIIIITIFPNSLEDLNSYKNLSVYQLANAFISISPVDIDIIRTTSFQNSDKSPKFDDIKTCHLYSIYNFLSECLKNNTVKMFKFIKIKKSLKIYINTIAYENFDIYMNNCCSNEYVCESVMFKNTFKSGHSKLASSTEKYNKKLDENHQIIINNIKMLIYQYAKKINDTKNFNSLEKRSLDDIIKYQRDNCDVYRSINYTTNITTSYIDVEESKIQVKKYSTSINNLTTERFVVTESTNIPSTLTNYLQTENNYYIRTPSESTQDTSIDTIMLQDLTTGLPNTIRQQSTVSHPTRNNLPNLIFFAFRKKNTTNKHAPSSSAEVNLALTHILDLKETNYIRSAIQTSTNTIISNNDISTKLNGYQLKYENQFPYIKLINNQMKNKIHTIENNKFVTKSTKMAEFIMQATENNNIFSIVNSKADTIGVQGVFIKNNNKLNIFSTTISQEFTKNINNKINESFLSTAKIHHASTTFKPNLPMYSKPRASIFENKINIGDHGSITLAKTKINSLGNITKLYNKGLGLFSISPNKSILYFSNITVPRSKFKFITKQDRNSKFTSKTFDKIFKKVNQETLKKISYIDPNANSINYRKNNNEKYFDLDFIKYSAIDNVQNPIMNTVRKRTKYIVKDLATDIAKDPTTDIISYIETKNVKDSAKKYTHYLTINNNNDTRKGNIKSNVKYPKKDGIRALTTNVVKDSTTHVSIINSNHYHTVNILKDSIRHTTETEINTVKNTTTDSIKYSVVKDIHDVVEATSNEEFTQTYHTKDRATSTASSTMDIAKTFITDTSKDCATYTVKYPALDTLTTFKSSTTNNVKYRGTNTTKDTIMHIIIHPKKETAKKRITNTTKDCETIASIYPADNTEKNILTTIATDLIVNTIYQTKDIEKESTTNIANDRTICTTKQSKINHVKNHTSYNVEKNTKIIVKTPSSKNATDNLKVYTINTATDLIMPIIKERTIDIAKVPTTVNLKGYTRDLVHDLTIDIIKNRTTDNIKDSIIHTAIGLSSNFIKNPMTSIIVKNHTKSNVNYTIMKQPKDNTSDDRSFPTVENAKEPLINNTKDQKADGVSSHTMHNVKERVADTVEDSTTVIAICETYIEKGPEIKVIKNLTTNTKNDSTHNLTTDTTIDLSIDFSRNFSMDNLKYYTTDSTDVNNPTDNVEYLNAANYSTRLIEESLSLDTLAKPIIDTKKDSRMDIGSRKEHTKNVAKYSTSQPTQNPITIITKKLMTRSVNDRTSNNLNYSVIKKVRYATKDSEICLTTQNKNDTRIDNANKPISKIINNPATSFINGLTADKNNNNTTNKNVLDITYHSTTDTDISKNSFNYPTANILKQFKTGYINTSTPYTSPLSLDRDKNFTIDKVNYVTTRNVKDPLAILTKYPIINNEKYLKKYTTKVIMTDSGIDPKTDNENYVTKDTLAPNINNPKTNNIRVRKTDIAKDLTLITKRAHRINTIEVTTNLKMDVVEGYATETAMDSTTYKENNHASHNAHDIKKIDVTVPTTNNILYFMLVTSKLPRTDSIEHRIKNTAEYTTIFNKKNSMANTTKHLTTPNIKDAIHDMNDPIKVNTKRLKTNQVTDHTAIRYATANSSAINTACDVLIDIFKDPTRDNVKNCTIGIIEYSTKHNIKAFTAKTIKDFTAHTAKTLSTGAIQDFTTNVTLALRTETVKEPSMYITKAPTSDISSAVTKETIKAPTIYIPEEWSADTLKTPVTHTATVLISDILRNFTMYTKTDAVQSFMTNVAPTLTTETVLLIDTVGYPIMLTSDTLTSTLRAFTTSYSTANNANELTTDVVNKVKTDTEKKSTYDITKNPKTDNVKDSTIDTANNLTTDNISDHYLYSIKYSITDNVTESTISLFHNKDSTVLFENKSSTLPSIKNYMNVAENNYFASKTNKTEKIIFDTEVKQNGSEKSLATSIISKERKFEPTNNHIKLPMLIKEVKELKTKASTKIVNVKNNIINSTNFQNVTTQSFTGGLSTSLSQNTNNYKAMINISSNKKNVQVSSLEHVIDIANSGVTNKDKFKRIKQFSDTNVKYRRSRPGKIMLNAHTTFKSAPNSFPSYLSAITQPLNARINPTTLSSNKLSGKRPENLNKRTTSNAYTSLIDNIISMQNIKYIKNKIFEVKPTDKNRSVSENDSKQFKINTPMSLLCNITEVHLDSNNLLLPVVTALPLEFSRNERKRKTNNNYLQSTTDSLLSQTVKNNVRKAIIENSKQIVTIKTVRSTTFNTLPIFTTNHIMATPDYVKNYASETHNIINTEAHIVYTNMRKNSLSINRVKTFKYSQTERTHNLEKKKGLTEKKYKKSKTVRYNTFKPAEEDYEATKKISVSNYHNLNEKEIILNKYSPTFKHIESVTDNPTRYTRVASLLSKVYTTNKLTEPPASHAARHKINYYRNINKENLLDPFGKTNLYPINKLPSHTQRKVMKRIRLSKQNREVLAMDTNDFFSKRLSSTNRLSRPILFNHMPVDSVTVVPKEYVLRPMFEEESFRPKPLFVMNDNDFYRKDFGLHHHDDAQTLRHKINYLKDTMQVPPEKETTIEKPIYLSTKPRILRDRIDYIRNVLHESDRYRSRSNVVIKPVIEVQNRDPLYYFRRSGLYNNEDAPTEANPLKPTRRRPRTIFFLSPTVPYNRYF